MGLNVSPPIWQAYINTILNSLQSRKYCEEIVTIYCCLHQVRKHILQN